MAQLTRPKNNALAVIVIVLFLFIFRPTIAIGVITLNVVNFGAMPDGETDSTNAILTAWDRACDSTTPT